MRDQGKTLITRRVATVGAALALTIAWAAAGLDTLGCRAKEPAAKGKLAAADGGDFAAQHLHYLPDGQSILASSNWSSRLLDSKTGALIRSFTTLGPGAHQTSVEAVAVSPDGKILATGSNGEAILWEVASGKKLWHRTMVSSEGIHESHGIAFSPDSRRVVLCAGDDPAMARVWSVDAGKEIATLDSDLKPLSYATAATFSGDGEEVLLGTADGAILLWRVSNGSVRAALRAHRKEVYSLAADPRGNRVLSASQYYDEVSLWDLGSVTKIRDYKGTEVGPSSVALSRDGKFIASCGCRGAAIWDRASGKQTVFIPTETKVGGPNSGPGYVYDVAFSPDGKELAGGFDNGRIMVWNTKDGKLLRTLDAKNAKASAGK
jgi:WD40 repeat protein